MHCFNPLDKFYKSHTGAVPENKKITFRVKGNFDSVVLLVQKDGDMIDNRIEMLKSGDEFSCDVAFEKGLYFYCFYVGYNKFIGQGARFFGELTEKPMRFQLTAYKESYAVPEWLKGGVIYQIFPDRFCFSGDKKPVSSDKVLHENWSDIPVFEPNAHGQVVNNDFFGGDLKGIIQKLDYLQDLGVTTIYLNPIFKAFSNHRYDTGDYMQIDELLGDENDLKTLIETANQKGIKIVLDGVFNHTGDDSLYFNKYGKYPTLGAYQSKDSKYYGWYNFDLHPDKYESWWGITVLPAVNEQNPEYIKFITGKNGVIDHYTRLGIGGWRLDVVDELPAEFVRNIRTAAKRANSDAVLIGEVWEDASNKIAYGQRREYFQGDELDSVMNYPLKNAIISYIKTGIVNNLSYIIKEQIDHYPKFVLDSLMNILSTHDTPRLITELCGQNMAGKSKAQMAETFISYDELGSAKNKVKIASLLQFTLCGVPCIYYGDEICMQGYIDPLNRRTYPWDNQDDEMLCWYKKLGAIRKEYSAFSKGEFEEIYANGSVFAFKRFDNKSEVFIATNLGKNEAIIGFDGELFDVIKNKTYSEKVLLKKNEFVVLVKK